MEGCGKIPARPYFTHLSVNDAKEYLTDVREIENPQLEVNGTLYVCKKCGSDNVGKTSFINPNTNEVRDEFHGENLAWCFNGDDETTLVDYEDYLKQS